MNSNPSTKDGAPEENMSSEGSETADSGKSFGLFAVKTMIVTFVFPILALVFHKLLLPMGILIFFVSRPLDIPAELLGTWTSRIAFGVSVAASIYVCRLIWPGKNHEQSAAS